MANLDKAINAVLVEAGGKWGVYAQFLDANEEIFSLNPSQVFYAASINKVPIAGAVYQFIADGKAKATDVVKLTNEAKVPGSGVLNLLSDELKLTIQDVSALMLAQSDNTAAKLLVDKFGVIAINQHLASSGLKTTCLEELTDSKFSYGNTTPREAAEVLAGLYREKFAGQQSAEWILEIMKHGHFNWGIQRYLPELEVSNKEGTLDDKRHEVAIIWADRPYVLAIFSQDLDDHRIHVDNKGVLAIAEISRLIYEATK